MILPSYWGYKTDFIYYLAIFGNNHEPKTSTNPIFSKLGSISEWSKIYLKINRSVNGRTIVWSFSRRKCWQCSFSRMTRFFRMVVNVARTKRHASGECRPTWEVVPDNLREDLRDAMRYDYDPINFYSTRVHLSSRAQEGPSPRLDNPHWRS